MIDHPTLKERILLTDTRASAVLFRYLIQMEPKKTILLPVCICGIVPEVVKQAGYLLEFVDIDPNNYCPDQQIVLNKVTQNPKRYSGLIDNLTYGSETDRSGFYYEIKNIVPEIFIIEDRCSNTPSFHFSRFGDLTLYSTGYAKQVDLGFGGYGLVNKYFNENNGEPISIIIKTNGKKYEFSTHSFPADENSYFRELDLKLEMVKQYKKSINNIYETLLPNEIQLGSQFNSWRFNIIVKNNKEIITKIFEANLFASNHFAPIKGSADEFPVAFGLYNKIINLFNDFYYSEEQAQRTCEVIKRYL